MQILCSSFYTTAKWYPGGSLCTVVFILRSHITIFFGNDDLIILLQVNFKKNKKNLPPGLEAPPRGDPP